MKTFHEVDGKVIERETSTDSKGVVTIRSESVVLKHPMGGVISMPVPSAAAYETKGYALATMKDVEDAKAAAAPVA